MSGEKTEQPTHKRLQDARKKGQVAKSKEISSAVNVIGVFLFLWIFREHYMVGCQSMIVQAAQRATLPFDEAFSFLIHDLTIIALKLIIPLFLVVIVCDVASNFFQIGLLFAFEGIKPSLNKLNPANSLKRIFSKKSLIEFVKSVVKVLFLTVMVTLILRGALPALTHAPYGDPSFVLDVLRLILKSFIVYLSVTFVVLAAADYFFQKRQHLKELMMTKEEVKREYKEMEGDPHIKSKRRQLHQELLTNTMLQQVKSATVVITNPTRLAVALLYEREKTKLPMIIAKGEHLLAKRIVEIAREEGVPIMSDVPLARDLYEKGRLDDYIPSELIEPVAEVLRWVYELKASETRRG